MAENNSEYVQQKDSPTRSVLKAISWRLIASGATFIISFVIFRQYTEKTYSEIFETASIITSVDVVTKLILYYFHERLWTNVAWGKYWRQRAWRRRYRKLHKKTEDEKA
jgi:uncharacterized membrane protein